MADKKLGVIKGGLGATRGVSASFRGIVAVIAYILLLDCSSLCGTQAWADEIDDLIPAIIQVESGGRVDAVSEDGCIGLMQISPIVLKEWDIEKSNFANSCVDNPPCKYCEKPTINLYNPKDNKRVGTWYLRRLKDHYLKDNYTIERMLAAYNGGITRLRNNGYNINKMPKETRDYVKKVMKLYKGGAK